MKFHVYEKLTTAQMSRIWDGGVVEMIEGKPCRKVAMGITADMCGWYAKQPRYIVVPKEVS